MPDSQDDKRRDEVLKRMLATPVKKQAQLKTELKKEREAKSKPKQGGN